MGNDPEDQGSSMIALLPITDDWCGIDLPHVTLAYVGEVKDLKSTLFNEMGKLVSALALISKPLMVPVTGIAVFGDTEKVNVLTLRPTVDLIALRSFVKDYDVGTYPDYKPHATIGPVGTGPTFQVPNCLAFDKLIVTWGDQNLTFSLLG